MRPQTSHGKTETNYSILQKKKKNEKTPSASFMNLVSEAYPRPRCSNQKPKNQA